LAITLLGAAFRLYKIDSLPPGETYDPAFYGLDALAILQGERPIYLESNFGREVMFSYLVASCVAVLGVGSLAIHVASAIAGILAIPATYWVAQEVLAGESKGLLKRYGGLVAALFLALSYWHLGWSRYGVRAILVPLFTSVTMAAFWRGMRTGSRWAFAGCGVLLGLSAYTYQAAWLLPLLVVLGFAISFLCLCQGRAAFRSAEPSSRAQAEGRSRRSHSRRDERSNLSRRVWKPALQYSGIVFGIALVVFAPMGTYLVTHPDRSTERIDQVYVFGDAQENKLGAFVRELLKTVLVFSFRGDQKPTINIPGRPALNPFFSLVFATGIGISLFTMRKPSSLLLLAWLGVMSLPGVLAGQGPTAKRIIGTLPSVAMLIAVGALALRRWREGQIGTSDLRLGGSGYGFGVSAPRPELGPKAQPNGNPPHKVVLLVIAVLVVGGGFVYSGVRTYRDYFFTWARDPNLFIHFEGGLAAIGQYVAGRPAGERVYVSPVYVGHPSILFNSRQRSDVEGYHGQHCLVLPTSASPGVTYIVVPHEDEVSLDALETYLDQGEVIGTGPLHYGHPYFVAVHVPAGAEAQIGPTHVLRANWDDKVQLLGYDISSPSVKRGESVQVTLHYQAQERIETDYTVFVQLLGPHNPATGSPLWSQDDSEPCRRYRPTSSWRVDERLVDRFKLAVPAQAPEGVYQIVVGFYDWRTKARLPVLDAAGQVLGDHVALTQVHVVQDQAE
jgi:hypothetical protein